MEENEEGNRNVLFSKTVSRTQQDYGNFNISVSMECDDELGVQLSVPVEIVTYEALSYGCPILIVTFMDGRGDLINAKKLDTGASYRLKIKSYEESLRTSTWILSHIETSNVKMGISDRGAFNLHFVHSSWKSFVYQKRTRGWSDTRYSNVVEEIASDSGFDVSSIEPTASKIENIQQPRWSNKMMLDWICQRARPNKGSGQYEYGISIDGKFFLSPFSSLEKGEVNIREDIDKFYLFMGSPPLEEKEANEYRKENNFTQMNIISFSVIEDSMIHHSQGAGGIMGSCYDYDTGEYAPDEVLYSESNNLQMSEWSAVNESFEMLPIQYNYGRNKKESRGIADNRIASIVNSMMQLRVTIVSSTIIHAGERVEVTIDNPPQYVDSQGTKNEILSGNYIIASVKNSIRSKNGKNSFYTELLLVSQGSNKKESDYYVSSKGGKV